VFTFAIKSVKDGDLRMLMIELINNNLICIEQHAMESTRRGQLIIYLTRRIRVHGIEEVSMG